QMLFIDSTMQTMIQAFRFSSPNNGPIENVMLYRTTLVNMNGPDNVIHSQDTAPVTTNGIYLRECTSVMSDKDEVGMPPNASHLHVFGGRPDVSSMGGKDAQWYVVDHVYKARNDVIVQPSYLQSIMSAGSALGWDLQYLGTAANPASTTGAKFVYD